MHAWVNRRRATCSTLTPGARLLLLGVSKVGHSVAALGPVAGTAGKLHRLPLPLPLLVALLPLLALSLLLLLLVVVVKVVAVAAVVLTIIVAKSSAAGGAHMTGCRQRRRRWHITSTGGRWSLNRRAAGGAGC
jgi:hypothetical protein